MRRPLSREELRLWAAVLATVRPGHGRVIPEAPPEPDATTSAPKTTAKPLPAKGKPHAIAKAAASPGAAHVPLSPGSRAPGRPSAPALRFEPEPIEPGRKRRLNRGRDEIEASIDLHGLDQFAAEDRLKAFLRQAQACGLRAVLVITGKGFSGDGVIRRRAPEWLADPSLAGVVAGAGIAHRRHGGEGALYVALKRKA